VAEAERRVGEIQSQIDALRQQLNPMSPSFERDAYRIPEIQARLTEADTQKSQAEQDVKNAREALAQVLEAARRAGVSPNVPNEPPR
jgi:septal ring factor EnvC (AmiA/AmiB activator)